ncbi:Calx-beta domain-containing protein [Limnospira platensis CENA597]|uniref:Calx-beta domain-containing protein n=1 Tax=Limnospira platensis TaxID=118562 RepID=UPI003DA0D67D
MENTREILVAIIPEPSDYPNPLPPLGFSGDGSVNPLTAAAQIEAALTQVNQQLTEFVASANFQGDLQTAFGASTDVELGATIIEALTQGETPNLKVLSARSMNGADGAFDSVTGTVYLSDAIIHSEKLVDVITEEFGHYIDSQLNEIDSPGDEGELFMRLVNGEALSEADITGLRNQDDWGFIWVEGEPVAVQMSASPEFAWTRLLGTSSSDYARALTTGSDGSIYVAGRTWGNLDGQTNSGRSDAFVTKYQPDGSKDWTRLLGTSSSDYARALTTGSDGSIYVAGRTGGDLDRQTNSGGWDAFISKLIVDEDEDLPQITIADTQLKEGDRGQTNARFVVTLDNPSPERVTVNYATADGTATVRDRDYRRTAGRLIFQPGQTRQVINVPVFGDTKVEPDETFTVNLSNPQNAELGRRRATGTILNDDVPGNNNPQPKPPNDDRFSSAENLGRLTGEIVRTDRIGFASGGDRNTEDYYRFHLNREGTVQVVLDDLFQNANLQFLGSTGDIINQSRNPGTDPEIITQRKLEPGTYYVRVFPHLGARTPYRLSIDLI